MARRLSRRRTTIYDGGANPSPVARAAIASVNTAGASTGSHAAAARRRGIRRTAGLRVEAGGKSELTALTRKHGAPQALTERTRIVLAAAAGLNNKEIAARVGVCAATAGTWRNRFTKRRMDGLSDEPRPGAPRAIGDGQHPDFCLRTLAANPWFVVGANALCCGILRARKLYHPQHRKYGDRWKNWNLALPTPNGPRKAMIEARLFMREARQYFAVEWLRHRRRIVIRALRSEDRPDFVAAVERSSAQSLHRRFFPRQALFHGAGNCVLRECRFRQSSGLGRRG